MIFTLLALAGPVRIAFLGASPVSGDLVSLIGEGYEVRTFKTLAEVQSFHPSFVVTTSGASGSTAGIDTFVPNLKKTLCQITSLPGHPKVLLCLPPSAADQDRQVLRPLTVQAARETGVLTIDSPTEASIGYAKELYSLVVDWKAAKTGWKIVSVDSEELDEGPAKFAIDGDPDTYWHTQYSPTTTKYPHEIVVDMGVSKEIGGFRCLPRQDGGSNGRIKKFEFDVSTDGISWSEPVASGSLKNGMAASMVSFKSAVQARYIRLKALSEQTGEPYASIAELDVLPAKFATGN